MLSTSINSVGVGRFTKPIDKHRGELVARTPDRQPTDEEGRKRGEPDHVGSGHHDGFVPLLEDVTERTTAGSHAIDSATSSDRSDASR